MRGISKSFPGVKALDNVDLDVQAGEVLALLGENGAGKSTLIKILGGAQPLDAGTIEFAGRATSIDSPRDAIDAGIAVIYQEFNLVPTLSARENIFLGQERARGGFVRHAAERREARQLFDRIGVPVDPDATCKSLTVAQQQVVEIAKALSVDARILVMDEPSATLTLQEVAGLFAVIRELQSQGLGIIYISHRLEEIFEIADRVTVLRDGQHVGTCAVNEIVRDRLIEWMVGRKLENEFPPRHVTRGAPRLNVSHIGRGTAVKDVSFTVHAGEILAVTGLVGAGRTELVRLLFGADRPDTGNVALDGQPINVRTPRHAVRAGVALLTEDRKSQGLVLVHSARENFGLPNLPLLSRWGFVRGREERTALARFIKDIRIKIAHPEQQAQTLSGGNQQKLVLAKWLQRNCEVVIFDEPTRGIDVGAKLEIYQLMNDLAAGGKAIIMVSSELPEVLGMADRILVMHDGRVTGEITDPKSATQEQVLELAVA
jgi:ABC-type sugar transport system ATPase subunit